MKGVDGEIEGEDMRGVEGGGNEKGRGSRNEMGRGV